MTYSYRIPQPERLKKILDSVLHEKLVVSAELKEFTSSFLCATALKNISQINSICKDSTCADRICLNFVYQASPDALAQTLPYKAKFEDYANYKVEITPCVTHSAEGLPYITIRFLGY